jgi:ligand-binding sensor domain-containing protein
MGVCVNGFGDWECQDYGGYLHGYSVPSDEIFFIPNIQHETVYISKNNVFFRERSYKIPEIIGAMNTVINAGAVSSEIYGEGFLVPEIWVGTEADGIVVIQPDTGKIRRYTTENGLPSNTIRSISTENRPGYRDYRDIWVATDRGLAYWDDFHWTIYTTADGLPSNNILGADSSIRGSVWAATAGGAAYFDGKAWKVYTQENGLPAGKLTGVRWQGDEVLFSTDNAGLIVFSLEQP